jgi:hypothetical protein
VLTVGPGKALALRQQNSADPLFYATPNKLTFHLYPYAWPSGQTLDSVATFVPGGTSAYSSGDLPGHPFSVTLPPTLAAGRYALVVSVWWPDSAGGANNGVYGFSVQLP